MVDIIFNLGLTSVPGANPEPNFSSVKWLKESGELVEAGEPIMDIDLDKAVIQLTAEISGVLLILVPAEKVKYGKLIGQILG